MQKGYRGTLILTVVGGVAVLGSYVWGALTYPELIDPLWGNVPESARDLYTLNMWFAAAGFLLFFSYFLWFCDPARTHVFGRPLRKILDPVLVGILVPSALWMPLALVALDRGYSSWYPLIALDLAVVALSSLGVLLVLLTHKPVESPRLRAASVIGALFFCLQTVVLDGLIWTSRFTIPG